LRLGFTMLEFIVAMVILGIALTGMLPLEVMHSRVLESLEMRYTAYGNQVNLARDHDWNSPVTRGDLNTDDVIPRENYGDWYLIPSTDSLARKLGAAAALSLTGSTATTPTTLADDDTSSPDYMEVGAGWASGTATNVYEGDSRRHNAQDPVTDYAVWTFNNVPPGRYFVLATWAEAPDQAANALYVIYDGDADASPAAVAVNQQTAPDGAEFKDRPWKTLKSKYFGSGTVKVRLYAHSTSAVLADAIRIVPAPQILSLDKSFNNEEVTIRVKIPTTP
jgi:prepilin-type N-terminal cleavage/methylation domain-containing protein